MGVLSEPAYICFCLTDEIILSGHPGTAAGLDAHTVFLPSDFKSIWTAVNYKGDLFQLTETCSKSGHALPNATFEPEGLSFQRCLYSVFVLRAFTADCLEIVSAFLRRKQVADLPDCLPDVVKVSGAGFSQMGLEL